MSSESFREQIDAAEKAESERICRDDSFWQSRFDATNKRYKDNEARNRDTLNSILDESGLRLLLEQAAEYKQGRYSIEDIGAEGLIGAIGQKYILKGYRITLSWSPRCYVNIEVSTRGNMVFECETIKSIVPGFLWKMKRDLLSTKLAEAIASPGRYPEPRTTW